MATRSYAGGRQAITLDDLLAQSTGGYVPPAQAAPAQGQTGGMSSAESALYDAIMGGGETEPRVAEKPNVLAQILMGIADAGKTYASIRGRTPLKTDQLSDYHQYLERQRFSTEQANERISEGKSRRRLAAASFLVDREQRGQDKAAMQAEREAARKETEAYKAAQLDQAAQIAKAQRESEERDRQTRIQLEKMGNETRLKAESMQGELRRMAVAGESDKEQDKVYRDLRRGVVANKAMISQKLAAGEMTPEQVLSEWQDKLYAEGLTGKYKEAIDAVFQDQIGPILMQYAPQQGAAPGPAAPVPNYAPQTRQALTQRAP